MKQTRTTLKELTARYRAVLLKCAVMNMMLCTAAGAASISDTTDAAGNRYIGSFGVPLKIYNSNSTIGTYYAVSSDLMGDAVINGVTATLNNASRVGSGNLSWTQSTGAYAEVSSALSGIPVSFSVSIDNIGNLLTTMNGNVGTRDYSSLPDGIKEALNVPFDGGQSIAEYLQDTWPGSAADINSPYGVKKALETAYSALATNLMGDQSVTVTGSTLTLNGTSAIVNRSTYSPASDGNIDINNSTINVGGTNALIAHTGIAFTGNSNLNVSQGATLTVTSSDDLVSLTDSNLTLNGTITGNVSLSGTAALRGTGTVSGNLNAEASSALNMKNSKIDAITAGTVTGGAFTVALDVNAVGGTIDHITATSFSTGTITINDLNFLSAQKSFTLTVLDGTISGGTTLVLSDAVNTAYNGTTTITETVNNRSATANWETAFTQTESTVNATRSLAVQNNKTLAFTFVENSRTPVSVTSLGDTIKLLNTMDEEAIRTMTNSTSIASYTVTENLGTTAAGTFTINGTKSNSSAATINLNSHTGFSVGSGATLNLQNIVFSGNTAAAGSVLTVSGGTAALSNVTVPNAVSVTSGTLTLSGGNSLGGLSNAGTITLTGNNTLGAMSGTGTLTNNGNLTLNGANDQIIGGTGRTFINAALTTTKAINQAITINNNKTLTANATLIGGAVTNNGTLSLTEGTLGQTVTGGIVQINGEVESSVALSNATINSGKQLRISADNVGTNLTNNGTLVLTGGALNRSLAGTGGVQIDGAVISFVTLSNTTVNGGKTLTILSNLVGTNLRNNGTLVLTGGTLNNALLEMGNIQIDGNVVSNVNLANVTINAGKKLTINADYVGAGEFNNLGTLALSGGTLGTLVDGAGTIEIAGNVISDVDLANVKINEGKKLTINADYVGEGEFNNLGTLALSGGTLVHNVSGAVQIAGNVTSTVPLSNATINLGKTLSISASNVGTNLTNNGTLALSEGTLTNAVSGKVQITGDVTSDVLLSNATINSGKTLRISAPNIGTGLTNNGTIALSGGTLTKTLSGNIQIAEDVTSNVALSNTTINSLKTLTISASNVGTGLLNNGILALSGGTLINTLSGEGSVQITGNVTSNVLLSNTTINSGMTLTIGAGNVGTGLTNSGTLALSGGTLTRTVSGNVQIIGDVTSNVALSNTTINSTKSLTIGAGNVGTGLTNKGTLILLDGTLGNVLSGSGSVQIAGNVTSDVSLSNVTINSSKTLTISAPNVGTGLTNNGTLALSGGTLENAVSGNIQIVEDTISRVSLSNVTINSGKTLRISANNIGTGLTNNGILALSGGTLTKTVSGNVQIIGNMTSNVALSNATVNGGNTLTIGAGNVGTGLTNSGSVALMSGTLNNSLSGEGTIRIIGDVVSNVDMAKVTIDPNKKLTINANYIGEGEFTNNGLLVLSGGILESNVSGAGTIQIAGGVLSAVPLKDTTITSTGELMIGADDVGTGMTNNGKAYVFPGTLINTFSGNGTMEIYGEVTSNVPLSNATINEYGQLTIGAGNVGTNLANNGILVLTDGQLTKTVSGTIEINGDVTSAVALSNTTVKPDKKLTISAGNIGENLTNNGTLALSGGTLTKTLSGNIQIAGDVTSNVDLANVTINPDKKLTINAGYVDNTFTNNGTLALSGGTLETAVSGAVQIAGDVISNVSLSNTTINPNKKLTISADNIGSGFTNNGTLAILDGTLAKNVSGTIQIAGNVLSNVPLSNTTISGGKRLTIAADNIGANLTNNGILALSGGTLTKNVSGTIEIAGDVTSNVSLSNTTINPNKKLTISAGNIGENLTNGGTLALSGGSLTKAVSGTIEIAGDVVSNVALSNTTINSTKTLTISASNVGTNIINNGILALSGGTLTKNVSGTIEIAGDVMSNVALSNTTVNPDRKLTISASNVGTNITNNGTLALTDGTLTRAVSGTVQIDGNVISNVSLSNATVNAAKQLMIGADNVETGITNNGTVVLTDGTLNNALSGTGDIRIAGNVVSETALSNVTVDNGKVLTLSADNVGSGFMNNGTVVLTGGEISKPLSGKVTVTGYTEMKNGADFSAAQIDLTEGILDIGTKTLAANTLKDGIVSLDLKEYAAAETLVTATPSGTVTLEIWPFEVTNKSVQHYTLTSTNDGYSLDFILAPFFAVSTTPFEKENAMNIAPFDASTWTGGDLYVAALNVAEIAVSELSKNGYEVTANDKNTTLKLADDLEDILTGKYQDNYQKVGWELVYGFLDEDYGRVKAILAETGTDTTPAAAQTAQTNAQAVISVVSSRLGGGSAVKGRSGGDFVAGDWAAWAQGMFNKASLNGRNGFDSDSTGFAAGIEYNINDSYKAGAGYAFAATDIKTSRSKTKVDTHTLFAYGEYKPDAFYVDGTLSYGRSSYDEKTRLLGLQSDYKAHTLSVQAMSGYVFENFTPEAGLRYTNVKEKAYTDALGARTAGRRKQIWTAVAGVKTTKEFRFEKGTVSTQAGAALTYDLKQGKTGKAISLANGTSYVVQGENNIKRVGLEIGAGASYRLNGKTDIGLSYEGKFKEHYADHTGMLNIKYSF